MTRQQTTGEKISVHVPFTIRKYGGRKQVVMPAGVHADAQRPSVVSTLVKALARAFRWKRMLESGEFTTVKELAEHEKLGFSYLTRVLRLSLLAPDIVEAILEGKQPPEITLASLLEPFPVEWNAHILQLRKTSNYLCSSKLSKENENPKSRIIRTFDKKHLPARLGVSERSSFRRRRS